MTAIGQGRLVRVCDLCGAVDDHPRHVIAGAAGGTAVVAAPAQDIVDRVIEQADPKDLARLLRDLFDTSTSDRHMDCCASAGCPDGTCIDATAGAPGKTGKALLTHLIRRGQAAEEEGSR
jgi:hypothetical protein